MSEAFICNAVFHLSEDGFRFYAPSPAVFEAFLGSQQLRGFLLVFPQLVIDFNGAPVASGFITKVSEGTSLTTLSPVPGVFADISTSGSGMARTGVRHVLSHRADEVIVLLVVIKVVAVEIIFRKGLPVVFLSVVLRYLFVYLLQQRIDLFKQSATVSFR